MSDSNLDDVLGDGAKKVETSSPRRETKKSSPKVEMVPRENPVPLAQIQDGKFPGDEGYVYDKANAVIQGQIRLLTDEADALRQASNQLHLVKVKNQVVRTDQQRYDRLQEITASLDSDKAAKAEAIRVVLSEMGLL